jgi:glycosyltransferase involved in cell wall biosynthesis
MRLDDVFPRSSREPARALGAASAPLESEGRGFKAFLNRERPLSILLIVESSAGGTGRHVLDLAEGMLKRGHRVCLAHSTLRIDERFRQRLASMPQLRCLALPMRISPHPADVLSVRAIRRLFNQAGPFDIVHGHSSKGGALARLVAIGSGAKAFYTPHGLNSMDPGMSLPARLLYLSIERTLSMLTDGIITVSPEEERAASAAGIGRGRTHTIPNGLESLQLPARKQARHELNLTEDDLVIGFVGRLVEQKSPDVLIRALAQVAPIVPAVRLAMVGDGPLEHSLRRLSNSLGVDANILWLGARDARQVLSAFDVFALPSRKEGLPYVILEAMAAGLPIVATSSAGVELLVEQASNGLVVPPGNEHALAQALIDVLQKPAMLARFGKASRKRVERFTVDAMVDGTLGFYRSRLRTSDAEEIDETEIAPA